MQGENDGPKVLCALSHGLYEPWLSILKDGQEATWLTLNFPSNFQLIHFHGSPGNKLIQWLDRSHEILRWKNRWLAAFLQIVDTLFFYPLLNYIPRYMNSNLLKSSRDVIHIKFPDTYVTYRWKFLALLNYFLKETDADFLFVTSTASYVQPKLVLDFVQALPNEQIYAGAEPYPGAGFISGSNRIISREIAQQVLRSKRKWAVGVIEDVAFTNLVKFNGNELVMFPIVNIASLKELDELTDKQISESYHFRLKSFEGQTRTDVTIMKKLHSRIMTRKGVNYHGE
jgi:hypothetical protein